MESEENKNNKKYETILLERIEKNIGLLAEGQSALREKVDSLETKVDSLETKFDSLETKVDSLVEDMDYVKTTLTENKERFKKAADKKVVDDHEKRLIRLENAALAKV